VGAVSSLVLVGVPILLAAALTGLPVAAVERRRLRLVDPDPVADPHRTPDRPGLRSWLGLRYREPATWRELGYAVLLGTLLWPLDLLVGALAVAGPGSLLVAPAQWALAGDGEVKLLKAVLVTTAAGAWAAVPVGVVALVAAGYAVTAYAGARAELTRALLAPRDTELRRRVTELTRSRARLVVAFDAERRRIERDLHDGAQQRLVALGMTLGVARLADSAEVPALLDEAHAQARLALEELQSLIRGIHPQLLTDRGLAAAVAELADRSPVPVDVDVVLPGRLPSPVEVAAYFVVCEALTNVARHSGATRAAVSGRLAEDRLVVEVGDDGRGGADPARGSGLTGLADRVSVAAGRLTLTSPPGGPTLLRVELPCALPTRCE
jgi:signal transduction histidine kinase